MSGITKQIRSFVFYSRMQPNLFKVSANEWKVSASECNVSVLTNCRVKPNL